MIKLNLRQNALHTLHHAVEHLHWSEVETPQKRGRSFNRDDHSVQWTTENGHLCSVAPDFTRLPLVYNLKFALLHLIQASELLLKSYVQQCEPTALFVRAGSRKTINLQTALNFTIERNPTLLAPGEVALLLEAKDFRNAIEHYEFDLGDKDLRTLCVDFLAICALLSQSLLSINIADAFSWDSVRDEPDEVAGYLSTILTSISETGRRPGRRAGELWVADNVSDRVFLCLNCGARAVSADRGICMGCGAEGDEDLVTLLEDFKTTILRTTELRKRLDRR